MEDPHTNFASTDVVVMSAPLDEREQRTLLLVEQERLLASIRYNADQCCLAYERVVNATALAMEGSERRA